jgi:hypothetical protein
MSVLAGAAILCGVSVAADVPSDAAAKPMMKGGCDHGGKAGMKGGCDHGGKSAPAAPSHVTLVLPGGQNITIIIGAPVAAKPAMKGGCDHGGKPAMKGGCDHGKDGKGGCEHGKGGKGGCDHGAKPAPAPAKK